MMKRRIKAIGARQRVDAICPNENLSDFFVGLSDEV
jgi:hypothetical protein